MGAECSASSVDGGSGTITLYYWPFLGRAGALIRMMEEKGLSYEHISSRDQMAAKCSAFGAANGVNIAPPIIDDGIRCVSQSTACCAYLGKKLGFSKNVDDALAMQYLNDIVDLCEGGIGKNNEDAASLKKFLEGEDGKPSRFSQIIAPIENSIKGPYFFGAEPSFVDFFLLQHMDGRMDMFDKLQAKIGKDFLATCPKIKGVIKGLRNLESYKKSTYKAGTFKQEIIDAYGASGGKIKLYYWPFLGRAGALIRMLEEKAVPWEHISAKDEMATKCAVFGAAGGVNIAPPVIDDGIRCVSQSTASCFYLGKKLGFNKNVDDALAVQYLSDIVDLCEGGIGKNNEDAAALKKFLEGDDGKPARFAQVIGPVERNIKGPYFFGAEPSFVDFFLLQHMDGRMDMFSKLQAKTGKDFLADYPKLTGVIKGLRNLESYKKSTYKADTFKQEIIDAY